MQRGPRTPGRTFRVSGWGVRPKSLLVFHGLSDTDYSSSWWLNSAAACRDGIIDNPHSCVTSDEDVAYAITMTQHTETNDSKDDSCSFTPRPNDPGAFKLMATINGEQRNPVRVLRSWRLHSSLAPIAGLRYDGLYVSYRYPFQNCRCREKHAHATAGTA